MIRYMNRACGYTVGAIDGSVAQKVALCRSIANECQDGGPATDEEKR